MVGNLLDSRCSFRIPAQLWTAACILHKLKLLTKPVLGEENKGLSCWSGVDGGYTPGRAPLNSQPPKQEKKLLGGNGLKDVYIY